MIEESLTRLGFSPSETKIYLHLLKNGSSWPNKISEITRLNRTNVYEALSRLVGKGLVSYVMKNNVKWYEAKNPNSILSIIAEKEHELKQEKTKVLDSIKKLVISNENPLEASIFSGKKGLRMVFEDIISARKQISLIAADLQFRKFFGPYFELWHKERIEARIPQRTIFPSKFKGKLEKRKFLEYRFANYNLNPSTTIMYGEVCLFIQWSKDPIAVKIQSSEIARSHLNYFNSLWNSIEITKQ